MKQTFGREDVYLFTKENENLIMKVCTYGARLVALIDKKTGIDIVQGFDSVQGYEEDTCYIGAFIGRTANRIANGRFELNGKTYQLAINNNGNTNHGGLKGFDRINCKGSEDADSVIFEGFSRDGDENYPGNLRFTVTYTLEEHSVLMTICAESDADTLFAPTSHAYFNLDGSEDAMHHEVQIHAGCYAHCDAAGLALPVFEDVDGTPFDFRRFKEAGKDINAENEQLKFGKGYDHYYLIESRGMRPFASLKTEKLRLDLSSDMPGMHFYTANWQDGHIGKNGVCHKERSSIALEPSYMPNAWNYAEVSEKPLLKAGTEAVYHIRWTVTESEER